MYAFTSIDKLNIWSKKKQKYVGLNGKDLFKLAVEQEIDAIIIDSDSFPVGYLTKEEISQLAAGSLPGIKPEHNHIKSGSVPKISSIGENPSQEIIQNLCKSFRFYPEIQSAYFYKMQIENQEPEVVIGFLGNNLNTNELMKNNELNLSISKLIAIYPTIAYKVINRDELQAIEKNRIQPFYTI